jgi:ectoine hydroxylase-related dioxygenase (phytanoyl-CoA dioxygenase family)
LEVQRSGRAICPFDAERLRERECGAIVRAAMLAATLLQALDRDGFVLVPDALDRGWVERLRRAFDDAPSQENGTQHVRLSPETPEREAWRALETHPAIVAAATHVLAAPFRVRDLHGRNPLPGFGQQGLHADAPPRSEGAPYAITTALWMIDDFTEENGATRIVPGSHLVTRPIPKSLAQPLARHPEERVVTGLAGSVLILNGHTWHAGRKNETRGPRRAGQMVIARGDPSAISERSRG